MIRRAKAIFDAKSSGASSTPSPIAKSSNSANTTGATCGSNSNYSPKQIKDQLYPKYKHKLPVVIKNFFEGKDAKTTGSFDTAPTKIQELFNQTFLVDNPPMAHENQSKTCSYYNMRSYWGLIIAHYVGIFHTVYKTLLLDHKSGYKKVGSKLAHGMCIVIPADQKTSDMNPSTYPCRSKQWATGFLGGLYFKFDLHQMQFVAMLECANRHRIGDDTMKRAWKTFENGDFLNENWYDCSHLTGKKRDLNPFNLLAEWHKNNELRNYCESRCQFKCGNKIKCLTCCGDKSCKRCYYREGSPSTGYPFVAEYLKMTAELSNEEINGDVFMRFVHENCI
jgi:hypothetical protein